MNIEIFKSEDGQDNLVDARTLHEVLESKQEFANWVKKKVVNNPFFTVDEDWTVFDKPVINSDTQAVKVGRPKTDYALTLDTAKKVAMAEQTDRGNEAREYFIQAEKDLQDDAILLASDKSVTGGIILTTGGYTSRKMAEVTGKRHADVIRDIKDELDKLELSDAEGERIFALSYYTTKQGKNVTEYNMSKDGWLQIGARYDAKTRYAIISYVDKLEKENKALKKSINDILIERLDNGERKIIKNFIKDTIAASGYSGLITAVNALGKSTTGKSYKEWLLKQLMDTFKDFTDEMTGKEYKKISMEADKVELALTHNYKNFLAYSRGQALKAIKKEKKKLEKAKRIIREVTPNIYTGNITTEVLEEGFYAYDAEDDNVTFSAETTESRNGDFVFTLCHLYVNDMNLDLVLTGARDATTLRTKDTKKSVYSAMLVLDNDRNTYWLKITKIG